MISLGWYTLVFSSSLTFTRAHFLTLPFDKVSSSSRLSPSMCILLLTDCRLCILLLPDYGLQTVACMTLAHLSFRHGQGKRQHVRKHRHGVGNCQERYEPREIRTNVCGVGNCQERYEPMCVAHTYIHEPMCVAHTYIHTIHS
jgi:hypothetical protein